jgi:hypothetical protein
VQEGVHCCTACTSSFFGAVALRPNAGHGLLILEVSRSHDAPHSIGLLWTSDQLVLVLVFVIFMFIVELYCLCYQEQGLLTSDMFLECETVVSVHCTHNLCV